MIKLSVRAKTNKPMETKSKDEDAGRSVQQIPHLNFQPFPKTHPNLCTKIPAITKSASGKKAERSNKRDPPQPKDDSDAHQNTRQKSSPKDKSGGKYRPAAGRRVGVCDLTDGASAQRRQARVLTSASVRQRNTTSDEPERLHRPTGRVVRTLWRAGMMRGN